MFVFPDWNVGMYTYLPFFSPTAPVSKQNNHTAYKEKGIWKA